MSYRCVLIKSADRMSIKDQQLFIQNNSRDIFIPLEDISILLIEDNKCNISAKLIAALSTYYIGLIICDDRFMPTSLTLPIHMHYKQLKVFNTQLNIKKPLNSQLWERITKKKILNQYKIVQITSNDCIYLSKLSETLKSVKSNDNTNREAVAAKYFFSAVYGQYFTRRRSCEDEINACLNYGYTILIACMSRTLAMYGFNTILGIHHNSMTNNFNLSCDLVEPFRPIVDYYVYKNIDDLSIPLTTNIKKALIGILTQDIKVENKVFRVEHAMEEVVLSYIVSLEKQEAKHLRLPEIITDLVVVVDEILEL